MSNPPKVRLVGDARDSALNDTVQRRRADAVSIAERDVFERLTANAPLPEVLESIVGLAECVCADMVGSVSVLDEDGATFAYTIAPRMPERLKAVLVRSNIDIRNGPARRRSIWAGRCWLPTSPRIRSGSRSARWRSTRGMRCRLVHAHQGRQRQSARLARGVPRRGRAAEQLDESARSWRTPRSSPGIAIERRLAEEALRESEAKFRGLFEKHRRRRVPERRDGRFLSVNPGVRRHVRLRQRRGAVRAARAPSRLYWNPTDRAEFVRRVDAEGEIRNVEFVARRRDGKQVVVLENARAVRDAAGRIVGYEGTINDITERKRAEQAVFAEKERAQVTLQSIGDAVISTDAAGPHRLHESGRREPHRLEPGRGARPRRSAKC